MRRPRRKKPKPALVDASMESWGDDPVDPEVLEEDRPPQFGMKGLLILPAVLAITWALLLYLEVFGVLVAFLFALIVQMVPVRRQNRPLKRLVVDLLWGVALPVLCLLYDPMFFRENRELKTVVFLAFGTQMLVLMIWLVVGRSDRGAAACFAGALYVGVILAGATGLILLPFSLIGLLIAGLGATGFTPFFTVYVFARNANIARRRAKECLDAKKTAYLAFLGIALAVGVPLILYWAGGDSLATQIERIRLGRRTELVPLNVARQTERVPFYGEALKIRPRRALPGHPG